MPIKRQLAASISGATWTKGGEFFGRIPVPRGANDVHWEMRSDSRRPWLTFTKNGEPIGPPIQPPPGANDFEFGWRGRGGPGVLIFTRNGRMIAPPLLPPPGANDLHLAWRNGLIAAAFWTVDGESVAEINVPVGANDAHFFLLRLP